MISFSHKSWGQEIGEVSVEYQPAKIRVTLQDGDKGTYNIDTGKWENATPPTVIYEGQARFAPIRWGVDATETQVFNASTTTRFRVQFPYGEATGRIPRGTRVRVLEAPRSPSMVDETMIVTMDGQNSDNGSRTLETEWNSDIG